LLDFLNDFKTTHRIQLDPIYTGKLFFAFKDLLNQGFFPKKSRIVLLHTGGLQGIIGFNNKHGKILL
jgi:1-aminocyclopropane-1-carboxylate deaminase